MFNYSYHEGRAIYKIGSINSEFKLYNLLIIFRLRFKFKDAIISGIDTIGSPGDSRRPI